MTQADSHKTPQISLFQLSDEQSYLQMVTNIPQYIHFEFLGMTVNGNMEKQANDYKWTTTAGLRLSWVKSEALETWPKLIITV